MIKNRENLLNHGEIAARNDLAEILECSLNAIDPETLIKQNLIISNKSLNAGKWNIDLRKVRKIIVVGAGKAAYKMALGVESVLGEIIEKGIIIVPYGKYNALSKIQIRQAGHPIPDENGLNGTEKIIELLKNLESSDLVICLISGGASALLVMPPENVGLKATQKLNSLLVDSGATIHEINTVRKHVSLVKGGKLAQLINPATCLTLIISDVPNDDLEMIGSGPTVLNTTTSQNALDILKKYDLEKKVSKEILNYLEKEAESNIEKKVSNPEVQNVLIGNNLQACTAAKQKAEELGYKAMILSTKMEGESKVVGSMIGSIAEECRSRNIPIPPPCALIMGGETTVTIEHGKGIGGRNQEFALAAALKIKNLENVVVASLGTDGIDGNSNYAGAVVDGTTVIRALKMRMDPVKFLDEHNTTELFEKLNDVIFTGPTFTNISDIMVVLVK